MVETQAIYLSVLEAGMSLVAVNLPSVWFLFAQITPEKILRSVRSMISLRSRPSNSSVNKSHAPYKKESGGSSSNFYLAHPATRSLETYAMHDIENGEGVRPLPHGNIEIKETITQTAEQV